MEELPHNIEVEQALLGSILNNNDAYYRVSEFLESSHFYEPVHQEIYSAAVNLIRSGKVATPVVILSFLAKTKVAGVLPIEQYIARLAAEATTVINAPDYARTIRDLSDRRSLIELAEQLKSSAFGFEQPTNELIQTAEERLIELSNVEGERQGFMRFDQAMLETLDMASRAYQREGGLSGTATGLIDLDHMMGGLQKSDLIVVAGRPGMGKTALATTIAYNIASAYEGEPKPDGRIETVLGGIVGFFSLEMSAEQLSTRITADLVSIPSSRIRRGEITEHDFQKLAEKVHALKTLPLYIDQSGGLNINQLISRARRIKKQRGIDVMIVDYIQLLSGTQSKGNRVQEVTEITTKLKALAKELGIPIIALSQLSRQVESREDKRPQLSDLRESGSIEQDADVVLFVYRESYYLIQKEPKADSEEWFKWEQQLRDCEGKAQIIISKQRHGPTGTVDLAFDSALTRFGNLARETHLPERRPPSFKERAAERGLRVVEPA